ncbi:MAG TPA: RidA family protein [Candidatus Eremiobacteraceae bacterium]|nr:RidA family protein [Candidatus Eremiobacteraceae bacterium]
MERLHIASGSPWEGRVGYARAVRAGAHVFVSGTTGTDETGSVVASDPYAQAKAALARIAHALHEAGVRPEDVVRTRIYVTDIAAQWEAVGRAHAEMFAGVRPACTMVEVRRLIAPDVLVEIEADAIVGGA